MVTVLGLPREDTAADGETRRLLGAACGDFAAKHSFYGFAEGFLAAVCAANEARHGA